MSVPLFAYQEDRDALANWSEKQGEAGIQQYWLKKNQTSLDGFATEIVERSGLSDDE